VFSFVLRFINVSLKTLQIYSNEGEYTIKTSKIFANLSFIIFKQKQKTNQVFKSSAVVANLRNQGHSTKLILNFFHENRIVLQSLNPHTHTHTAHAHLSCVLLFAQHRIFDVQLKTKKKCGGVARLRNAG
jgi:hypothetical protein